MRSFWRRLIHLWRQFIYPPVASLIATVGLLGLAIYLLILYVLIQLSDEVLERETQAFDHFVLQLIQSFSNPTLDTIMLTITQLNNPPVAFFVASCSTIILCWRHYYQEAKIFILNCLGGVILSYSLKYAFGRPRPDLQSLLVEKSYSYPSGHALGSVVLYGFLAYLLSLHYRKYAPLIYLAVGLLIAAVGFSRLYLGLHWPSDIIAGYCVGFLWLMLCVTLLKHNLTSR